MSKKLTTQYITSYLEKGTEQAEVLMSLLQDERNVLSKNDSEALEIITNEKEKIAETMQICTRQCGQHLQQAGFGDDNLSLNNYIVSCNEPITAKLQAMWNHLQATLKQCQDENRINGKLISSSQRRIKQALSILQGQPVEEDLYGKKGTTVNQSSGNSLSHA